VWLRVSVLLLQAALPARAHRGPEQRKARLR
jgi:hypothetical protein